MPVSLDALIYLLVLIALVVRALIAQGDVRRARIAHRVDYLPGGAGTQPPLDTTEPLPSS